MAETALLSNTASYAGCLLLLLNPSDALSSVQLSSAQLSWRSKKQQERQSNGLRSLNSRYSLISIAFERYCLAICHSSAGLLLLHSPMLSKLMMSARIKIKTFKVPSHHLVNEMARKIYQHHHTHYTILLPL